MTPEAQHVLELRQQLAKSSTKKLDTILARVSEDGWLRRNYKYYGAHTGRWSGEGEQKQNFPRGILRDDRYSAAVEAIRSGRVFDSTDPVLDLISSCLRGSFRAPEGKKFVVCDLSSIEPCVLQWLSGCEAMRQPLIDKVLYEDFAAKMYKIARADVENRQRQIAKSA